jgi:hypothetical protein
MPMKRSALLSAGAAVVIVAGGVAVAGDALASGTTHTLHLTTTRLQFVNTSKTTFVQTEAVFNAAKKVGYETISCNDGGSRVKCSLSFALENGMLLGHMTIPITSTPTTTVSGKITGGLGTFTNATGTVKGRITGKHSTFTVKYHS